MIIDIRDPEAFSVVCAANTDEWLRLRKTGVGASEIAAVLNESPYSSALRLYLAKRAEIPTEDISRKDWILWGHRIEPILIQAYEEKSRRCSARSGLMLRSKKHPWALATLDGVTWEPGCRDTWPLECKNVSAFKADDWQDGAPSHVVLQAQHQMLVTGTRRCTVTALLGGNRDVWCDIERDETTIRKIIAHGEVFWERVEQGNPPDAAGEDAAKLARELHPSEDGETKELSADMIELAERIRELRDVESKTGKELKEYEGRLKLAMGNASVGVFAGSPIVVTYKNRTTAAYMRAASTFRVLGVTLPKELKKKAG